MNCKCCGKEIKEEIKYRKGICRECYNKKQRIVMQERSSTLGGYFKILLSNIKNDSMRNKYDGNEIDLDFLLKLWNKQNGKCAITKIDMEWGFADAPKDINKKYLRKPYNASIDRIDNTKGYTKNNVWLVCSIINTFKGANDLDTLYYISDKIIANKHEALKIHEEIINKNY